VAVVMKSLRRLLPRDGQSVWLSAWEMHHQPQYGAAAMPEAPACHARPSQMQWNWQRFIPIVITGPARSAETR
jgi:hypothetical protein